MYRVFQKSRTILAQYKTLLLICHPGKIMVEEIRVEQRDQLVWKTTRLNGWWTQPKHPERKPLRSSLVYLTVFEELLNWSSQTSLTEECNRWRNTRKGILYKCSVKSVGRLIQELNISNSLVHRVLTIQKFYLYKVYYMRALHGEGTNGRLKSFAFSLQSTLEEDGCVGQACCDQCLVSSPFFHILIPNLFYFSPEAVVFAELLGLFFFHINKKAYQLTLALSVLSFIFSVSCFSIIEKSALE